MQKEARWEKHFSGIIANLLVTVTLALIGIWGSYSINTILACPLSPKFEVWGFYLLVIFFVIISSLAVASYQRKTSRAQQELIAQAQKLEETIRTLPPEGFLRRFSDKYEQSHKIYKSLLIGAVPNQTEIELSIRGVLSGIVQLTEMFDRAEENDKYAANIMIFTDEYKNDEKLKESLVKKLHFSYDEVDVNKLNGMLCLQHSLSTNSASKTGEEDAEIKGILITLPVPYLKLSETTGKFQVLPGAPLAILEGTPNIYYDTGDLPKWLHEYGDFNETIAKKISAFFVTGEGKNIKSFCSFPLHLKEGEKCNPIAVLNIHKNRTGLISRKDQFIMFFNIISPFIEMLSELVVEWKKHSKTMVTQ